MSAKLLLAGLLSIAIAGCITAPKDPIRHSDYKDLENPFSTDTITIYLNMEGAPGVPKAGPYAWTYIELTKWTDSKHAWFTIDVRFQWSDWRFMTGELRVKTLAGVAHLKDPKPSRDVVRRGIVETIRAQADEALMKAMADSPEVQMQFFGEPVSITKEGLNAIKVFYQRMVIGEKI